MTNLIKHLFRKQVEVVLVTDGHDDTIYSKTVLQTYFNKKLKKSSC